MLLVRLLNAQFRLPVLNAAQYSFRTDLGSAHTTNQVHASRADKPVQTPTWTFDAVLE